MCDPRDLTLRAAFKETQNDKMGFILQGQLYTEHTYIYFRIHTYTHFLNMFENKKVLIELKTGSFSKAG